MNEPRLPTPCLDRKPGLARKHSLQGAKARACLGGEIGQVAAIIRPVSKVESQASRPPIRRHRQSQVHWSSAGQQIDEQSRQPVVVGSCRVQHPDAGNVQDELAQQRSHLQDRWVHRHSVCTARCDIEGPHRYLPADQYLVVELCWQPDRGRRRNEPGGRVGGDPHHSGHGEHQLPPGMAMPFLHRARPEGEGERSDIEAVADPAQSNRPASYCIAPTRLPSLSSK